MAEEIEVSQEFMEGNQGTVPQTNELPIQQIESGPIPDTGSPFVDNTQSPFGDLSVDQDKTPNDNVATPMRTFTAAVAMIADNESQVEGAESLAAMYNHNVEQARGLIENQKEYLLQLKAVTNRTKDILDGITEEGKNTDPTKGLIFSPEVTQAFKETVAAGRKENYEKLARIALDDQALRIMEDHLRDGNYTEFKAAANRLNPNTNSTYGVIRAHALSSMIISRELEKANLDVNQEGFLHNLITSIASLPEAFLFGDMFSKLGNVPEGTPGYKGSFWRWVMPYSDFREQIMTFQGLARDPVRLAEESPKFFDRWKDNSDIFGMHDPGRYQEMITSFRDGLSDQEIWLGNGLHWLDLTAITSVGKVARGAKNTTELMTGIGARKAAASRVAEAFDETITKGADTVAQNTAILPDELMDHGLPKAVNPLVVPETKRSVKGELLSGTAKINPNLDPTIPTVRVGLSGEVSDTMAAAREIMEHPTIQALKAPSRNFSKEEAQVAVRAAVEKVKARTASNVADHDVVPVTLPNGQTYNQLEVVIDRGFATPDEAENWLRSQGYGADPTNVVSILNRTEGEVVQDVSGIYYPRVKVDIAETGYLTNELNPPKQGFLSRWILSPSQTMDRKLFDKMTMSGQIEQQWRKVTKDLNKDLRTLGPNDRKYLEQVALKGSNEMRWFSDGEFRVLWERATGKMPSDKVEAAYRQFKTVNDIEYKMRNAQLVSSYALRGFEDVNFVVNGKPIKDFGEVKTKFENAGSNNRIYDTSTNHFYKKGELTPERMKELEGQGFILVRTEKPHEIDGIKSNMFIMRKGDLEANPIPKNILAYRPGGHRLYGDKYFVKQAKRFKQKDTGEEFLEKPGVFVTAGTRSEGLEWASIMEKARVAVRDLHYTAQQLDELIFRSGRGLPSGQDFLKGVDDGTWNLDDPFEVTFDRELPTAYQKNIGASTFDDTTDDIADGFGGFYQTHGRMYYGHKSEVLKRVDGSDAPTIDPFKAQNEALYNISRMSSFEDFKTTAVHRWVNTYGAYLDYDRRMDPLAAFNSATIGRTVSKTFANQIEGQRAAIKRVLGFRTDFDLHVQNGLRSLHEFIAGESDNAFRKWASKGPLWLMDASPVNFLRGLAFDMKLGLFNFGQFFIQTSTFLSIMALKPGSAMKMMSSVPPVLAYRMAKFSGANPENVLDLLSKNGAHKLAGFATEKEFKDYVRFIDNSGFFAFGDSHNLVNNTGPMSAYAIMDKVQGVRTMGRMFFNEAENWNRLAALRASYDEAVEKFGKADFDDWEFNEMLRGRAENYSFNMSQTSKAAWQNGVMSIPTQFWAYSERMLEAMLGKDFTLAQKLRLMGVQLGLAGTAGLPIIGAITDMVDQSVGRTHRLQASEDDPRGQPDGTEKLIATLKRGLFDRLVFETTGADIQIGKKLGTGDFFTETAKRLAGMSQYGPVSFADVAGGATYSIMGEAIGSAMAVVGKWMSAESGGNDVNLYRFEVEDLFRQVSSINNVAFKAWFAHQYGIYQSMRGQDLVSDLPPADAAFIAMGFAPGELREREAIKAWKDNRQESIDEAANFVNRLWSEGIRQPDKMDQNSRTVEAFLDMVPATERLEVIKRAQLRRDPSDYSRLLRIREDHQSMENIIDNINEEEVTE
jgi:hypothetical protein